MYWTYNVLNSQCTEYRDRYYVAEMLISYYYVAAAERVLVTAKKERYGK